MLICFNLEAKAICEYLNIKYNEDIPDYLKGINMLMLLLLIENNGVREDL